MQLLFWIIREKQSAPKYLAKDLLPNVEPDPHAFAFAIALLACLIQIGLITMLPHAQLIFCLQSAHTGLQLRHCGAE